SAKGVALGGGGSGGGINEQLLWNILADDGTEQIAKNHLTTALSSYVLSTDIRLSNARPASDVYEWAKQATKPTYSYGEITGTPPAVDLSNYVDKTSNQDIIGIKTFTSGKVNIGSLSLKGDSNGNAYIEDLAGVRKSIYAASFVKLNGNQYQLLRADGGIMNMQWVDQGGAPVYLWGTQATNSDSRVYPTSSLRVANANTVGDIAASNLVTKQNWTSVVDGRYLPLGGGIMSGFIRMPNNVAIQASEGFGMLFYDGSIVQIGVGGRTTNIRSDLTIVGNIAWHAGNFNPATKLEKSTFDDLFTVEIKDGKKTLKINYPTYTQGSLSAKGLASGSSSGGGGINEQLLWNILEDGDNPTKQIALSHLSTALSGYVTTNTPQT
ncbi:MAG: hypothetical protein RSC49_03470, partial [Clostridium sp.]